MKPTLSTPTLYAQSSVDSVVSIANSTSNSRRRRPPPPPPRTSSRSPLASPLRSPRNPRPLPSLPAPPAESNHLPLVMKVAPLLSPQSTMLSQRRNSSLSSDESKVPTVTETSKINTGNNQLLLHSTRSNNSQRINFPQDGLLRVATATSFPHRRASQTENNSKFFFYFLKKYCIYSSKVYFQHWQKIKITITICLLCVVFIAAVVAVDGRIPLTPPVPPKRETLETRHQELLKTQRQLQEQYDRLQKFHGVQFVPGAAALPTLQQSSPMTSVVMSSPYRHTLNLQTTGTFSELHEGTPRDNSIDAEASGETKTVVSNGPSENVEQSDDSVDFNDQSSTAAATKIDDVDCDEKGRDLLLISLLLDNTHETDIL